MNILVTLDKTIHKLAAGLLGMTILVGAAMSLIMSQEATNADSPTFYFATNQACSSALTTLDAELGETLELYICIDADNEGAGLLGAETHVSYTTSDLTATSVECNVFDTCIDLSESGTIKLLAASGPLPEGTAATSHDDYAKLELNFTDLGSTSLGFTTAQVINQNQAVENRTGTGITITVLPAEIPLNHCANLVQDSDETGVDCGGATCNACAPLPNHCANLVQDSDETGVDCGGATCNACSAPGTLASLNILPLAIQGDPLTQIQILSTAEYNGGRADENITSCFSCPTPTNPTVDGTTTYNIVSGPGYFVGSRLYIDESAEPGEIIIFNVTFYDNVSSTELTSDDIEITVTGTANHCANLVQDADETAVDCGGADCGACLPVGFNVIARPEGRPVGIYDTNGTVNFHSTISQTGIDAGAVNVNSAGTGVLASSSFPASTYDVGYKAVGYLKKYIRGIVIPPNASGANLDFTLGNTSLLLGGDVVSDNLINSFDLATILNNYLVANPSFDLSRDGTVNSADLTMVLKNYLRAGDTL